MRADEIDVSGLWHPERDDSHTRDPDPLAPCVHCGFCLPACPTYIATGDEADSPRGRIVLMRALERGEIGADDAALVQHLDACLGCRGCEPVCPSGVAYGRGLEQARERLFVETGPTPLARVLLGIFRNERIWRPLFQMLRVFRASGIPRMIAGRGRLGFGLGMIAATEPWQPDTITRHPREGRLQRGASGRAGEETGRSWPGLRSGASGSALEEPPLARVPCNEPRRSPTVALFRGCIMDTLYSHIHDATRRTLEANGYSVVEVGGQVCCGALHEHAGDRPAAEALARRNLAAFAGSADYIAVNSAGCGALLKDYGHLLRAPAAEAMAARVRDVTELLAAAGPRPGAPLELEVVYDAPCHLQHAQRVQDPPLAVLRAIPGLRLRLLPGSDRCCGSAGIYSMLRPAMSQAVLASKIESFAEADPRPDVVATGNPGCLMQIGAGFRAARLDIAVAHPVELLAISYQLSAIRGAGSDRDSGNESLIADS